MIFGTVAHAKGISVGKITRDVPVIGKRNMRACFRQAHMISIILLVAMREQANSRFLTSADDGEQNGIPPGGLARL